MNFELFKNFCKLMMVQDESLYNVIWEFTETCGDFKVLHNYIDTKYPSLSKYVLDDNCEDSKNEGLVYYMEYVGDRAKKQYLDAYLVANYLVDERPDLIEMNKQEWEESVKSCFEFDDDEDEEYINSILESCKSDEELQELYDELDFFATKNKPKVTNVTVSNGISDLFDKTKQGNNVVLEKLNLKEVRSRRELDKEPIKRINTERYAKSVVEFIKSLLKRASELNKTDGYILARDFDIYNLGRLKYGDRKQYWDEYSDENGSYLISSKDFDDKELKENPSYDSLDCFSIDGDVLTIRLNFSSDDASNDRSDLFVYGGIPEYKEVNFDYLKSLLWNEGIIIEKEDHYESNDGGWTHRNTDVLTIRYYRNEKDKEKLGK